MTNYYDRAARMDASAGVQKAVEMLDADPRILKSAFAIDLGCGEGRDTRFLLKNGWRVLATDVDRDGISRLITSVTADQLRRLKTQVCDFANTDWQLATLINAALSLPFCPPKEFPFVWSQIIASLIPEGLLAVDLFTERHAYAHRNIALGFSKEQVDDLLKPFEVVHFDTWEGMFGNPTGGPPLPGEVYSVIARRR